MFLSKAHCPICKSANVRQSQRHAEGLFRRERHCGGCGIRFRLNFIQSLAHILSTPHPHGPELHQALPSRLSCHVLTPAFSPNSSYYPVQERLKASGVPQEESNELRLSCAGRTFQFDIKLQRPFAPGGRRDSPSTSLNAVRDIALRAGAGLISALTPAASNREATSDHNGRLRIHSLRNQDRSAETLSREIGRHASNSPSSLSN